MNRSKTSFRKMLQSASSTYQHCLRKAADLMEADGISLQVIVDLGTAERKRRLEALGVRNAASAARRIPVALIHLASLFPDAGLPAAKPMPPRRHALPRRRDEERHFRADMVVAWRALKRVRAAEGADARKLATDHATIRSCREYRAASARAGVEMDHTFDLEIATYETVALSTIDRLRLDYTKNNVQKIMTAMITVSALVLHLDHPHIGQLIAQRRAKANQPSRALSHRTETKLAEIMTNGGVQRLQETPNLIAASSEEPGLGRKDEIARLQHAVLLGLKVDHPGLTEQQGVRLHLNDDVRNIEGRRHLILSPVGKDRLGRAEPMTEESCQRVDNLLRARRRLGLTSMHLYPTRAENHSDIEPSRDGSDDGRRINAVLESLYAEVERLTGMRLTFQDIKDLIVRVLLVSHIDEFVVARRAGYKYVRSMQTRMRTLYQAGIVS